MKVIIIAGVIAFILSVVATMFFTGTFSRNPEQTTLAENETQKDEPTKPTLSTNKLPNNNNKFTIEKPNNKEIASVELKDNKDMIEEPVKLSIQPDNTELPKIDPKEFDAKYEQLAKLYSVMKPENAASVMCELEPSMTGKIISKMNERTAGKIMGAIADKDPNYVAKVSKLFVNTDK